MPRFQEVVREYWEQTEPLFVSTSTLFRFSKKLKGLKPLLRCLGKDNLGDLSRRTREAHAELCNKQAANLLNPTTEAIVEERDAFKKWDRLSTWEEEFLKQIVVNCGRSQ